MSYRVERFDKGKHKRDRFHCEEEALINYVKNQVTQDEKRNLAKCYVLIDEDDNEKHIKGFYTLSSFSVDLSPEDIEEYKNKASNKSSSKIPSAIKVPSALIGRLARHSDLKGTEAGSFLMADALQNILNVAEIMSVHFIIVDAKNEFAKRFYRKFGFIEFGSVQNRMYLPVKTIHESI